MCVTVITATPASGGADRQFTGTMTANDANAEVSSQLSRGTMASALHLA